jgi:hypothetical protein
MHPPGQSPLLTFTQLNNYLEMPLRNSLDRHVYDGQQKGTICDARGSYPHLKHTEASFSPNSIDSLYLRVAEMPRTRDMAIFVRRLLY